MQNLISLWQAMNLRRKLVVAGATLAMFLAVLGLARMASSPQMVLLYAGLEAEAAGAVMASLDQRGIAYEVRGDSIFVDHGQRDGLRMALAGEGLPSAGGAGYELLDTLTGFGTTSQMFDAAYWRAKEGELARTILTAPSVKAARVHISQAPSGPFRLDDRPTASVTVTTSSGNLSEEQARAFKHLIASAVAGMRPDDVQVIDSVKGLIAADEETHGVDASDRAQEIKRNVERLLEARVGTGKAIVEVSVELVTEQEQITERKFDPQGRVAISTETEESSENATEPGGNVTVASNLPEGDGAGGENGQSNASETRERVNYEVSETQRELVRAPGGIRRMTVAVLIDGQLVAAADGSTTWQARSEEELASLRELVSSAVGLEEARGDILTLKSLEFLVPPVIGTEAQGSYLPAIGPIDVMSTIQIVVLGAVALILGLFVIRPIFASGRGPVASLPAPGAVLSLPSATIPASDALVGEVSDSFALPASNGFLMSEDHYAEDLAVDPATRLRRLIDERQNESIEILRSWLEPEEETA